MKKSRLCSTRGGRAKVSATTEGYSRGLPKLINCQVIEYDACTYFAELRIIMSTIVIFTNNYDISPFKVLLKYITPWNNSCLRCTWFLHLLDHSLMFHHSAPHGPISPGLILNIISHVHPYFPRPTLCALGGYPQKHGFSIDLSWLLSYKCNLD